MLNLDKTAVRVGSKDTVLIISVKGSEIVILISKSPSFGFTMMRR